MTKSIAAIPADENMMMNQSIRFTVSPVCGLSLFVLSLLVVSLVSASFAGVTSASFAGSLSGVSCASASLTVNVVDAEPSVERIVKL